MSFSRIPVRESEDFRRIRDLPIRGDEAYPRNLAEEMTRLVRTPGGTQTLFDVQAKALWDLGTHRKGFLPIRVSGGKTLISFLAPRMVDAKRPLLLIPAALTQKTERDWLAAAKNWRIAKHLKFASYQTLGRVSGATLLDTYKPDMIIADEAFFLKNIRAAVTRRVARYMEVNPTTIFVPMAGTIIKHSVKEMAHLMKWSHGSMSALPLDKETLFEWAEALDEGLNMFQQKDPGVLLDLFPGAYEDAAKFGDDNNRRARRVFQLRLQHTPGVVVADAKDQYTGSLQIDALEYTPNDVTEQNFKILRETMCRPDGWALTEAVQAWAVARQLILGLHYTYDPLPPEEWLLARKLWAAFVREYLASTEAHTLQIDSELQVVNGVDSGQIEDEYGLLAEWRKIKPTFEINSVPVWHDQTALKLCSDWLHNNPRGICWVEHRHFARELERISDVPYFGAKGYDRKDNFIEDATGPVIASIAANSSGRNLQHKWDCNLVTAPPADSERWEQLLARTHRYRQQADSVTVEVLCACREHLESIPRALSSSEVKKDLLGWDNKLKIADITWPSSEGKKGPRYA